MPKKQKTLHIKPNQLWPANGSGSTLYLGDTVVQFCSGKKGKRVVVRSNRHRPRHKAHPKRIDKRGR